MWMLFQINSQFALQIRFVEMDVYEDSYYSVRLLIYDCDNPNYYYNGFGVYTGITLDFDGTSDYCNNKDGDYIPAVKFDDLASDLIAMYYKKEDAKE